MSQKTIKREKRQMRKAAMKEIPTVVRWTQDQMLARIGMAPPPRYVPKWLWRRIKAFLIQQYKTMYVKEVPRPKTEAEVKQEQADAKAMMESIEEPCPLHNVDYLDDNNVCHAEYWEEADPEKGIPERRFVVCGWKPAETVAYGQAPKA